MYRTHGLTAVSLPGVPRFPTAQRDVGEGMASRSSLLAAAFRACVLSARQARRGHRRDEDGPARRRANVTRVIYGRTVGYLGPLDSTHAMTTPAT